MNKEQFEERRQSVDSKTSESSESSTPEEHSDEYSTITALKTPRSLHIVRTSETERRDTLPDSCFSKRKRWVTIANEESDEEEEEDEEDIESDESDEEEEEEETQRRNSELFMDVTYLSSKGFMEYFQNNIFPNVTGRLLGFSDAALNVAQAAPGSILCNREVPGEKIPFRVIPAVAIDWPIQATEYLYRKDRQTIIDKKYGVVYKWPTKEMVQELHMLKCVAIPKGELQDFET